MAEIILTGIGAVIGSLIRFGLLTVAPRWFGNLSELMIVVINLLAAFFMGMTLVMVAPEWLHTFLAPGILGGLSTFSAPIVDIADAIQKHIGDKRLLLFKTLITFVGGLVVLWFGTCVGTWIL